VTFSPFFFNLVADTLSKKLIRGQSEGFIKGLGNFNDLDITHLQFADYTLIFLNANDRMVAALKLLLLGFENLIDSKIN
jgi:hypothetical protein